MSSVHKLKKNVPFWGGSLLQRVKGLAHKRYLKPFFCDKRVDSGGFYFFKDWTSTHSSSNGSCLCFSSPGLIRIEAV